MTKPLGNKPGEPPFQLKIEPDTKLFFKYKLNEPCTIEMKITNTTKDRQTFKVKCTDNDIFRVRPPLSFVKADETAIVKIILTAKTPPENNRHFFAVYHMKCTDDTGKTARQVWTPDSKAEGVARIIAVFESADAPEKKEEKKKEIVGDAKTISVVLVE
ncbi:MSP domain protein [Necator americanus]|uniref:Major sperm protein n=1 Tax=Necator americanus TaxID=51031 RepID=W2TQG0_NECAM|nr:MSP domain protein [Necator americanus]ETN83909.1 MSP domain protein [Necator americanus]